MIRSFLLGVIVTLLAATIAADVIIAQGLIPASAQVKPSQFERWAARQSLRSAIGRATAGVQDPIPQTPDNLAAGVKLYAQNCVVCHAAADKKPSLLAQGFYIRAPILPKHGVEDDPEPEIFWKIAHGIRFSAMPAFEERLTDAQIWQLTQFLKHMDALPPSVDAKWRQVASAAATP